MIEYLKAEGKISEKVVNQIRSDEKRIDDKQMDRKNDLRHKTCKQLFRPEASNGPWVHFGCSNRQWGHSGTENSIWTSTPPA